MKHAKTQRISRVSSALPQLASVLATVLAALFILIVLGASNAIAGSKPAVNACATATTLEKTVGARGLVAEQTSAPIILIRPDKPKVGRPVIAWLSGHQPGRLLVARQIKWNFHNAASLLKNNGGGSASTIFLTPGQKTISVAVTDLSGDKKTATCSFTVTW